MENVSKLYWALNALGFSEEATRLREDVAATREGGPEAVRRLEATVAQLRWALGALGSSTQAQQLRKAALAARDGNPRARAYLDRISSQQPWPPPGDAAPTPPGLSLLGSMVSPVPGEAQSPAARPEAEAPPEAAAPAAKPANALPPVGSPATEKRRFSIPDGGLPSRWLPRWDRRAKVVVGAMGLLVAGALAARLVTTNRERIAGVWAAGREHAAGAWRGLSSAVARVTDAAFGSRPPPTAGPQAAPSGTSPAPPKATARATRAPTAGLGAGPTGAAPVPGAPAATRYLWRAQTWGLSVADVLRAFPGTARTEGPPLQSEGLAARVALARVRMAGHLWLAQFLFDSADRLDAIQLRPAGHPSEAAIAGEDLAAALVADYGRPRGEEKGPPPPEHGRRLVWTTADGLIELQESEIDASQARVMAVDLRAGDVRPLPDRRVILTLRPPERVDR